MTIRRTSLFQRWLDELRDSRARYKILVRIKRLEGGNAGDVRPIGKGLSEMRIDYGPGYRVYSSIPEKKSSSCCAAAINPRNRLI
jgi:putative addiction module killer protein